jgi:polyisoprenoid-binding protein YceI
VRRSPILLGALAAAAILAAAGIYGFATLFLHPAPAAVSLDPGASQPPASLGSLPTGAISTLSAGLDGAWSVDTSIGSFADFSDSWVGYRVNETLGGNRANTAVGRTPSVSGTLALFGTQITSVDVTADLSGLKSDDDRRDGQLRRQGIETGQFPQATFKLTAPIDLGSVPVDGRTFAARAIGELTLHGVTKAVQVPIQARLSGDVVTVAASIDIQFADYGIQPPQSFVVLSVENHGTMELQLHFRHASRRTAAATFGAWPRTGSMS